MVWQITPYSAATMLAAGMAVATAIEIWRQRSASGGVYLALAMIAIAEDCFSAALESAAVGIQAKVFWSKVEYIGIACSPTLLLMFALAYRQRSGWLEGKRTYLLWLAPSAIILMAWTNEWHGYLWSSLEMAPGEDNILIYGHGPGFFVAMAYYTLILGLTAAILLFPLQSLAPPYRHQIAGVIMAFLAPWALGAVYVLEPSLVRYLDAMPLGVLLTALMLNWSLLRHRMLDLVPVARDALVEVMSDGMLVLDARDRIVDVNPAAMRLFELAEGSPIGVFAKVALARYPQLCAVLRGNQDAVVEISKDGEMERYLEVRISTLQGRSGTSKGRVVVLSDVTERKLMEERLQRASKLETTGQIAAQVSHDFNNLLVPMIAYPELIKMQLPEDHAAVQFCDAMLESAQLMSEINEEMMVLGRRGHLDFEPTDLNRVIEQALARLPDPPETLQTELELASDLLPVRGSSAQLQRVVMNLVANAREAMGTEGRLSIKTENVYLDRPIAGSSRVEIGEYVRLSVSDDGCGIPAEIRGKIFDAFFSAKGGKRRRGSGLGLSIVQSVVNDHSGYVDLESELGKGSTFYVYLPISREGVKDIQREGLPRGTETILVVDDDSFQREAATQVLLALGYQVDRASSGEAALEILKRRKADLLMLDMVMPGGIDGAETYRRALKIKPGQRAIIVSGFAESERVAEAQAQGAGSFVRKPVNIEKLARTVRQELDR